MNTHTVIQSHSRTHCHRNLSPPAPPSVLFPAHPPQNKRHTGITRRISRAQWSPFPALWTAMCRKSRSKDYRRPENMMMITGQRISRGLSSKKLPNTFTLLPWGLDILCQGRTFILQADTCHITCLRFRVCVRTARRDKQRLPIHWYEY